MILSATPNKREALGRLLISAGFNYRCLRCHRLCPAQRLELSSNDEAILSTLFWYKTKRRRQGTLVTPGRDGNQGESWQVNVIFKNLRFYNLFLLNLILLAVQFR